MEEISDEVTALPEELSCIPFQNLQKYANDFRLNFKNVKKKTDHQYHRDNKNRPREVSSKKPQKQLYSRPSSSEQKKRDPRFDDSCGQFKQQAFDKNYKFLRKLKKKENKTLRIKLADAETSPEEREKIKLILQRHENQLRELKKKSKETELLSVKRNYEISQLQQGKQPFYQKKAAQKLLQLAEQFEELKQKGSLGKHMKRRRKKKAVKDTKKINVTM